MAFSSLSKTVKFVLMKQLSKFLISPTPPPKSLNSSYDLAIFKNSLDVKKFLTARSISMKTPNVYESLVNQNISQTKFCTKPEKERESKPPPGRHFYHQETEDSINEQISAELKAAYSYLSMACYFGRTEVALPGCQGFFMNMYQEELCHAMVFINYQLLRGAYVGLSTIDMPECQDWESIKNAFCTALEMEKNIKEKLVSLFDTAEKHKDLEVMDIVSTQFMEEQNRSICEMARLLKISDMSADPVGQYLFDKLIYNSFVKSSKNNLMYKNKLYGECENKMYK